MSWNASMLGKDYIMEVKHENHIILTKAKHDMKLCFVPCVGPFLGIPIMFLFAAAGPAGFFAGFAAWLIFVFVLEIWAVYTFCLNPKKAEYSITFSPSIPIHVRVIGTGEMQASAHEYRALKDSLYGGPTDQGLGIGF
jgi:hypothetical protein